jgi:hypothetical protein
MKMDLGDVESEYQMIQAKIYPELMEFQKRLERVGQEFPVSEKRIVTSERWRKNNFALQEKLAQLGNY